MRIFLVSPSTSLLHGEKFYPGLCLSENGNGFGSVGVSSAFSGVHGSKKHGRNSCRLLIPLVFRLLR